MLIKKTDIGGEIISILTKGMYLDPKDALREYIQNGVDAKAQNIDVKIRNNSIVIQDDGNGMDKDTIRRAIRVGISDKNPIHNVGFMGIGIYSSFHLCDELNIYSKREGNEPHHLRFDFKKMRVRLEIQKEKRFQSPNSDESIIALQDLLEDAIDLTQLTDAEFSLKGTRIEMVGIDSSFYKSLAQFEEVSNYLEQVIPLHFHPEFRWGKEIEHYIYQTCKDHHIEYTIINLNLQINELKRKLYRPYKDEQFDPHPLEPYFQSITFDRELLGFAWGCLNASNKTIKDNKVRGFVLKKNGFTIGNSSDLINYFGRLTYFNRYVGEFIITHPKLLPNAARSEFEYSPLRVVLQERIHAIAYLFNVYANNKQEESKAQDELKKAIGFLRETKVQLPYFTDKTDNLLANLWQAKDLSKSLKKRIHSKRLFGAERNNASEVVKQLEDLGIEIKRIIEEKNSPRKKGATATNDKKLVESLSKLPEIPEIQFSEDPSSLIQVFELVGIEISDDMRILIELIDENFIRLLAKDNIDYGNKLQKLVSDYEDSTGE